jgi:hypothetical protein
VKSGATLLLIAAVGILAALAFADGLRPKDDTQPAAAPPTTVATTTRPEPPTLLGVLHDEAISGFVVYSDQDCRLHSLLLPRMIDDVIRDEGAADIFHCRFEIDGGRIVPGHPSDAGRLEVHDGNVVAGDRIVLTHEDLVRAARRHPNIIELDRRIRLRIRVTGLASFGIRRPVVAMEITVRAIPQHQWLLALFDGHGIRAIAASFRGPYRHLFQSNDGALIGTEDGTVITRTGRTIDPPQGVPASRAIAFSPDDRWIVRVNGTSTFLVGAPEGAQASRIIRLPIPARDLVWEPVTSGTSIGPPIRR